MTAHMDAKKEEIAKKVIMSGDPLRVKYIAENYLENARLVNTIRNIYAYTGTYKGVTLTVMASGMGMASMGIYAYELFHFYDVDRIIRIGTCGSSSQDVDLLDIILVDQSYTLSNYALLFSGEDIHKVNADLSWNDHTMKLAKANKIKRGNIITSDLFYQENIEQFYSRHPKNEHFLAIEMETFVLFFLAHYFHKKASCLLTVVDSPFTDQVIDSEMRESGLDAMISLALNSIISID